MILSSNNFVSRIAQLWSNFNHFFMADVSKYFAACVGEVKKILLKTGGCRFIIIATVRCMSGENINFEIVMTVRYNE